MCGLFEAYDWKTRPPMGPRISRTKSLLHADACSSKSGEEKRLSFSVSDPIKIRVICLNCLKINNSDGIK